MVLALGGGRFQQEERRSLCQEPGRTGRYQAPGDDVKHYSSATPQMNHGAVSELLLTVEILRPPGTAFSFLPERLITPE